MPLECKNNELPIKLHKKYFYQYLTVLPSRTSSIDSSRVTIAFFAVSGLDILNGLEDISDELKKNICDWIYSLQVLPSREKDIKECGFQGSNTLMYIDENKEPCCISTYACGNVAMTYTGLATLVILGDDLCKVNRKAVIKGVKALQQEDGSFCGSLVGGENDMRFVYCAACVCYMLQDWSGMDIEKTVDYIVRSMSYDYGIAQGPNLESHGGSTYCAIATLVLMGRLHDTFNRKQIEGLKRWLISRQISGFQGRPNKPEDTCYSFWVGATLKMLDMYEMVNYKENREYVLSTQNPVFGGFSKWVDCIPDIMHTYLGMAGLSLMNEEGLLEVNPALNITTRATSRLKHLQGSWTNGNKMLYNNKYKLVFIFILLYSLFILVGPLENIYTFVLNLIV